MTKPEHGAGPVATKIDLAAALATFGEPWSPRIVGRYNRNKIFLAKAKGEFVWHSHPDTDDLFLVLEGRLTIQLRDGDIELGPGEMFVVPRGVEHCPRSDEGASIPLIEPEGTPNTGDPATAAAEVEALNPRPAPVVRQLQRFRTGAFPTEIVHHHPIGESCARGMERPSHAMTSAASLTTRRARARPTRAAGAAQSGRSSATDISLPPARNPRRRPDRASPRRYRRQVRGLDRALEGAQLTVRDGKCCTAQSDLGVEPVLDVGVQVRNVSREDVTDPGLALVRDDAEIPHAGDGICRRRGTQRSRVGTHGEEDVMVELVFVFPPIHEDEVASAAVVHAEKPDAVARRRDRRCRQDPLGLRLGSFEQLPACGLSPVHDRVLLDPPVAAPPRPTRRDRARGIRLRQLKRMLRLAPAH